jgi:hypothetical protein
MTYVEGRAALQLIAEEEIGTKLRATEYRKDARFASSIAALKADQ